MKVKVNFRLVIIGANYVVIPLGEKESEFPDLIQLNEVGAFLWKQLQHEKSIDELVDILQSEYDADYETIKEDTIFFVEMCLNHNLLE